MFNLRTHCRVLAFAGLLASWAAFGVDPATGPTADSAGDPSAEQWTHYDKACGQRRQTTTAEGAIDYRTKNSNKTIQHSIENLDNFHVNLAAGDIAKGSPNRRVKADLDFALTGSPNHHRALELLVRYDLMGGRNWDWKGTECYLGWARQFAPDDVTVYLIGGYYFWKKNDPELAEAWWTKGVEIDPRSADANYNLGLLYLEQKQYDKALQYARVAYDNGFPLPGLRDGLKRAGHWPTK